MSQSLLWHFTEQYLASTPHIPEHLYVLPNPPQLRHIFFALALALDGGGDGGGDGDGDG